MRSALVTRLDGPGAVEVVDLPEPDTGDSGVLIEVAAAGVCFPDVLLTRGRYQVKPELPFVPGSELAGTVVSAPQGSGFRRGMRVAAFPWFGGFAEYAVAPVALTFPLPDEVGFRAGAALPMNYLTCHFALLTRGGLRSGETVLVHGAAGGIGTAAVQLAAAYGARVIAVVSSPAKGEIARAAGAHEVIAIDGFSDAARALTGGRGVDIVVDPVGGDRMTDSLRALASLGRHLVIGFTEGAIPSVKVNRLLLNNLSVVGVGWGEWMRHDGTRVREQWHDLVPLMATGRIDPVIGAALPLDQVGEALTLIESRQATGKVLLLP